MLARQGTPAASLGERRALNDLAGRPHSVGQWAAHDEVQPEIDRPGAGCSGRRVKNTPQGYSNST